MGLMIPSLKRGRLLFVWNGCGIGWRAPNGNWCVLRNPKDDFAPILPRDRVTNLPFGWKIVER